MDDKPKIGSQLKITLPNDLKVSKPIQDIISENATGSKPLNMEDISRMFAQSNTAELFAKNIMKEDMFFYDVAPATGWQKFKYKFRRVKDAWDVLRGNKDVE